MSDDRRRRLGDERKAIVHKFVIDGHKGYLIVGLYPDGAPGEIFISMAKEGSTVSGMMDTIAALTSIALQHGVSVKSLVKKFSHVRFEPHGYTNNKEIQFTTSIIDYVFRYLGSKYLEPEEEADDEDIDLL